MRFVHIADVHLDTPFRSRSRALRGRLRRASREAFGRGVELALGERVDAFLVAGDLFDDERLSFETERFLLDELRRLTAAGVTVVYATGNHDAGTGSGRRRAVAWPPGMHVVADGAPRTVEVRRSDGSLAGRVTAAGHASPRVTEDLSAAFPPPSGGVPEVGLLHTQVRGSAGAEEHEPYAPATLAGLQASGHDYWALGHVHRRQELSSAPPVHYPGNPQGRTPAETDPRGCLLVALGGPAGASVRFHDLAPVRWEVLAVDGLRDADTLDRLGDRVEAVWEEARAGDTGPGPDDWIVVVDLSGPCPLWRALDLVEEREAAAADLARRLGALEVELRTRRVHPVHRPEAYVGRPDVLAEALGLIRRIRSGEEAPPAIPPEELAGLRGPGRPEIPDAYLRSLLEGAEEELLTRMLRSGGRSGTGRP